MIVDDSAIIADRLLDILKDSENIGWIGHAGDYPSAVRQLAERPADVAFLDINLPGKSGIALLQYIKTIYPSIIVIMITNRGEDYYRKICHQMGVDYFIDKSGEFDQIPSIISSLPGSDLLIPNT